MADIPPEATIQEVIEQRGWDIRISWDVGDNGQAVMVMTVYLKDGETQVRMTPFDMSNLGLSLIVSSDYAIQDMALHRMFAEDNIPEQVAEQFAVRLHRTREGIERGIYYDERDRGRR